MGRWTVCGMARAAFCAQALFTLAACSNANLGWDYFPGYGHLHGYFPPLRVTGPVFVSAGATCSSAFQVGFSDPTGGFLASTADVKLQLSGSGTPTFYSDPTCTQKITDTTLATGALSQTFYLRNPNAGHQQIQTMHPDLPGATRDYQVDPAPPARIRIKGPSTFFADACASFEIYFEDVAGNRVPFDSNDTLNLTFSSAGGGSVHDGSDTFCQVAGPPSFTLFPGQWNQFITVTSPTPNDPMTLSGATVGGLTLDALAFTTRNAAASSAAIAISNIASDLQAGDCDSMSVYPVDADGNAMVNAPNTAITFSSSSGTVSYFTDNACSAPVGGPLTANMGSLATLYVRDSTREKTKLIAAAAGLSDGTLDVSFSYRAVQMAAGDSHSCVLMKAGLVECWGSNEHGQLGIAATNGASAVPLASAGIVALPPARQVVAGGDHTCAIVTPAAGTDEVWCWGKNDYGQLGPNGTIGSDSVVPLVAFAPGIGIVSLAAGANHTCAVDTTHTASCWGDNRAGQIGDTVSYGSKNQNPTPVAVPFNPDFVSAAGDTTCTEDFVGNLTCWGSNAHGQLQQSPVIADSVIPVLLDSNSISAGLGPSQVCRADLTTYDITCWGSNKYGELGGSTGLGSDAQYSPVVDTGLSRLTPYGHSVLGGDGFTCVVLYDSSVLCFGRNDQGQLGNGSTVSSETATLVPVAVTINYETGLGVGKAHACAAQWDGRVACWGANSNAQLGVPPGASGAFATKPIFLSL